MIRAGRVAALLLLSGAFAGCGALPTTHYYLLEPQHAARPASVPPTNTVAGLSVGVAPFQVDAPYDQDRVVYRIGEASAEVGYYAYHRWASPLSRMIPQVVAGAFGNAAGIAAIEPLAPGRRYDATLVGRVLALEEVDVPAGAGVRIDLTLSLVSSGDGTVLWRESATSLDAPIPADEVPQVVDRIGKTLHTLLDQLKQSLEQAL